MVSAMGCRPRTQRVGHTRGLLAFAFAFEGLQSIARGQAKATDLDPDVTRADQPAHPMQAPRSSSHARSSNWSSPGSLAAPPRRRPVPPPPRAGQLASPLPSDARPVRPGREGCATRSVEDIKWELVSHCSRLPGDAGAEQCWDAYRWLDRQVAQATSAGSGPDGAATLERLNHLAQQLAGAGSVGAKVAALAALAAAERRRLAREGACTPARDPLHEGTAEEGAVQILEEEGGRRDQLVALFHRMDANHDGFLSVMEFRKVGGQGRVGGHGCAGRGWRERLLRCCLAPDLGDAEGGAPTFARAHRMRCGGGGGWLMPTVLA